MRWPFLKPRKDDLPSQIEDGAMRAVENASARGGAALDFSEASLATVEEMLAEAVPYLSELTKGQVRGLVQDLGSYVLEVARRSFGGAYSWYRQGEQPVLVVGEPQWRVALTTWGKVQARLKGDEANSIIFHYAGFAERVRRATPGDYVLFV